MTKSLKILEILGHFHGTTQLLPKKSHIIHIKKSGDMKIDKKHDVFSNCIYFSHWVPYDIKEIMQIS